MSAATIYLKYKKIWLLTGFILIAIVVHQTLTSSPVTMSVSVSDKFMHTLGYFILMGWFMQIYHENRQRVLWGLFFIAMGISMEFLQDLGGVRFYEVNDMLANGLGVIIAWGLSMTKFSNLLRWFEQTFLKVKAG